MKLEAVYSELDRQIKMMEAGSNARPISIDVHKDTDGHHVIVEFSDSTLIGVNFEDDEPFSQERRELLEAGFAVVCGISLAFAEAGRAG